MNSSYEVFRDYSKRMDNYMRNKNTIFGINPLTAAFIYILGSFSDLVTTYYGMSNQNGFSEANTAIIYITDLLGVLPGLLIIKSLALVIPFIVTRRLESREFILIVTFLSGALFMFFASSWNLFVLIKF